MQKQFKTTSTFKRVFRRELAQVLKEVRANERGHKASIVTKLVRNTLRQRSGHYMKKTVRQCWPEVCDDHRAK